jgi:periplasmic divalent cation tolerance protein
MIVVVTSVGTEEQALDVGEALVRQRLAACVNMVPSVHSIYRWKGRICHDSEYLLFVKTLAREFPAVAETIRRLNSYELPEILAFDVRDADEKFRAWVASTTEKPRPRRRKASPKK